VPQDKGPAAGAGIPMATAVGEQVNLWSRRGGRGAHRR